MRYVPLPLAAGVVALLLLALELLRQKLARYRKNLDNTKKDLQMTKEELSRLEKSRSGLLARIGSAVHGPLSAVRNTTDELTLPAELSSTELKSKIAVLSSSVEKIDDFLLTLGEMASLDNMASEEGAEPLREAGAELKLDDVVSSVLQSLSERMSAEGLNLTVAMEGSVAVKGNERYLRQALGSLFSETVQSAPRDSIVSVNLSRTQTSARLTIDYRGECVSEGDGEDLGVELARQILGAHGGWISSAAKRGKFNLGLPLFGGCTDSERRD
jgi:K+-sensing histidine kinase KdpD